MTKSSENTGADVSKTYSARGVGGFGSGAPWQQKLKKSGTMLKAESGREQLICNDFCQVKFSESHNILLSFTKAIRKEP